MKNRNMRDQVGGNERCSHIDDISEENNLSKHLSLFFGKTALRKCRATNPLPKMYLPKTSR